MESLKEQTVQNVTLCRHRYYAIDDYTNCSHQLDHNLSSNNSECLNIYRPIDEIYIDVTVHRNRFPFK